MRRIISLALLAGLGFAADLPRKAPDLAVVLPDGRKVMVSDYHGKVLCMVFMLTTCPHCQKATQILSGLQNELGPKGFAVLEGAVNPDANIPLFVRQFNPPFFVGAASQMNAMEFMQISPVVRTFVPYIAFIDRKGMIRNQLTGGDLSDGTQEKTLRSLAESLVNEPAAAAKPKAKKATH